MVGSTAWGVCFIESRAEAAVASIHVSFLSFVGAEGGGLANRMRRMLGTLPVSAPASITSCDKSGFGTAFLFASSVQQCGPFLPAGITASVCHTPPACVCLRICVWAVTPLVQAALGFCLARGGGCKVQGFEV